MTDKIEVGDTVTYHSPKGNRLTSVVEIFGDRCQLSGYDFTVPLSSLTLISKSTDGGGKKEDLLPCPFCGNKPEWINLAHPSGIPALQCSECQFSIQRDRRDKTLFYWNRRQQSALPGLKEKLKEINEESQKRRCNEGLYYLNREIQNLISTLGEDK